jgi:hypothetical protein
MKLLASVKIARVDINAVSNPKHTEFLAPKPNARHASLSWTRSKKTLKRFNDGVTPRAQRNCNLAMIHYMCHGLICQLDFNTKEIS